MNGVQDTKPRHDDNQKISRTLWVFYMLFLVLSVVIVVKIIYLQYIWEPDGKLISYFRPRNNKQIIEPERGSILDCNGKLLANSTPLYDMYMDCVIQKDNFAAKSKAKADTLETEWRKDLRKMCDGLAGILKENGKDGRYYYNNIINYRQSKKSGRRNYLLASGLDFSTVDRIKKLPLAEKGSYKSGLKFVTIPTRQYPYGSLASRVIGDVTIDRDNPERNRFVGIEGQYDYILHGKEGIEWMKVTDKGRIVNPDSTIVLAEDGKDIRTTIDIDIQDIADKALRKQIEENQDIEAGTVVMMDVKTGAVKAMVNLYRNQNGRIGEYFNLAIGRSGEPGSIFKAVTLSILLEDGKVSLDTEIPTNRGIMRDFPKIHADESIQRYEAATKKNTITVLEGFARSSNYVFRTLAVDNYRNNTAEYVSRLYEYRLNDGFKFDLTEKGGTPSQLPQAGNKGLTATDLASIAIGYTVKETPLNMLMFYNAIANDGKMMKPYIIDSYEENGRTVKRFKPEILSGSLFSKSTADTLTRALKAVTAEGTASRKMKNAKCVVAGKTGTARVVLTKEERGKSKDPYQSDNYKRKFQATFVGFFPADEPQYTAIVTIYTKLTGSQSYGGGNIPALVFKEIVDDVWSMDSNRGNILRKQEKMPDMKGEYIGTGENGTDGVPALKGMGLMDAVYAIENNGYRCVYEGIGHVTSQSPAPGTRAPKGTTVKIILK